MAKLNHYPFPDRNVNYNDNEIFYIKSKDRKYIQYCYNKIVNPNSASVAYQYFVIEKLLVESFQYVMPIWKNEETCSARFATTIREASNLFEIIARKVYRNFFSFDPKLQLDIYNFLTLENYLDLSKEELRSPLLETYLENNNKIEPFESLKSWNKKEKLNQNHIPKWWTAYNKIKHNTESIEEYANLNNAIYSMAGLFIFILKIYGEGLICGFLRKPSELNPNEILLYQIKISDIFIGEIFKTKI